MTSPQQPTKYELARANARSPPYRIVVTVNPWGRSFYREIDYLVGIGVVPQAEAEVWKKHIQRSRDAISTRRATTLDDARAYFAEARDEDPAVDNLIQRQNDRRAGQPWRLAFNQYEEAVIAGYWVTLIGVDHYDVPQQLGRWLVNNHALGFGGFDEWAEEAIKDAVTNKRGFDKKYLMWAELYQKAGPLGLVLEGALPIDDHTMQAPIVPESKLGLVRWRNGLADLSRFPEVYGDVSYQDLHKFLFPDIRLRDQREIDAGSGKTEELARRQELTLVGIINSAGTVKRVNELPMAQGKSYVVGEPGIETQTMGWTHRDHRDDVVQEVVHGLRLRGPRDPETVESYRNWHEEVLARNIGGSRNPRPDDPQYWLKTERDVRNHIRAA